jgi:hypothetical protein
MCIGSFFFDYANWVSVFIGSEPGESTKISGVAQFESLKTTLRSNNGGSVKYEPRFWTTNFEIAGTSLSGRIILMMMRRLSPLVYFSASLDNLNSWGSTFSYSSL